MTITITTKDSNITDNTANHEKIPKEPPFVKMYLDDVAILYNLPKKSGSVLYALIKRLTYDGVIVLSPTIKRIIADECSIVPQSLNNAIQSLVNKDILRRLGMGELMPDPAIFSRGPWVDVMNKKNSFEEIKMEVTYSEKCGREIKVTTSTEKPVSKKGRVMTKTTPGFDMFWNEYPKRVKKKDAFKIWVRLGLEKNANHIVNELKAHKAQPSWFDPEFIPQPTTWLNGERWEDEIENSGLSFAGNTPKYGEAHKPSFAIEEQPKQASKPTPSKQTFEQQRQQNVSNTADSWLKNKNQNKVVDITPKAARIEH